MTRIPRRRHRRPTQQTGCSRCFWNELPGGSPGTAVPPAGLVEVLLDRLIFVTVHLERHGSDTLRTDAPDRNSLPPTPPWEVLLCLRD